MSVTSFIGNILKSIANLFQGLLPELKSAIHVGVTVADAIKKFDTNTPLVGDIITVLIPGDLDDAIKEKIREALPKVLTELKLVDATLGLTDPQEIVKAAVDVIQKLDGDYNSAFLHNLSIIVAQVASDGKLDWKDGVYLLQWYYHNKYNKD